MSAGIDRLRAEVAETKTANDGLRTLIAGLSQQIRDAAGDEDAVNELADELDADQGLSAAVLAGTPAEAVADDTVADIAGEATGDSTSGGDTTGAGSDAASAGEPSGDSAAGADSSGAGTSTAGDGDEELPSE